MVDNMISIAAIVTVTFTVTVLQDQPLPAATTTNHLLCVTQNLLIVLFHYILQDAENGLNCVREYVFDM